MNWLGFVVIVICLYLAFKVAGVVLRLALWMLIVVAGYWFLAPLLGWPPLAEIIHVLGP
ncbi:MAG: hypothetical protein ACREO8_13175 [Luteimonas sp.]